MRECHPLWRGTCLLLLLLALVGMLPAMADTFAAIQARGVLKVGVKPDVPPFAGLAADSDEIVGLEPDLARDLAERFGVAVALVPLLSDERIAAVQERRVDVLIAKLSATPQRRSLLTIVEPSYYESGVGLLARRGEGFGDWSDLRDQRICSQRGSFYNRPLAIEHGIEILAYYHPSNALLALRQGRCVGLIDDAALLGAMLRDANLAEQFESPLPPLHQTGWHLALHPDERGGPLEQALATAVMDWHRDGLIVRLEQTWNIPASTFARRMMDWARAIAAETASLERSLSADEQALLPADLARIVERGILRVAMPTVDMPPLFAWRDGEPIGPEADLARALARELGVSAHFSRQADSADAVVALVARQEADIGIGKLARTLERARNVRFSAPYLRLHHALVLNRLAALDFLPRARLERAQMQGLRGHIGVVADTRFAAAAARHFPRAQIRVHADWEEAVAALLRGDLVGAYRDEYTIKRLLDDDPIAALGLRVLTLSDVGETLGIAVATGDTALLDFINLFLEQRVGEFDFDALPPLQ